MWGTINLVPHPPGLSILALLVNPFFEELIVRGYFIVEYGQLRNRHRALEAVSVSAALQAGYHAYQGMIACVGLFMLFVVYGIFFQRTKRLWPVVLSHEYFDLIGVLSLLHH